MLNDGSKWHWQPMGLPRRCPGMSQISLSLAVTHDGWFREPAIKHVDVALRLWWRHLQRHQPLIVEIMDWTIAGGVALALVAAELIANA
jgi:hypothetical protein